MCYRQGELLLLPTDAAASREQVLRLCEVAEAVRAIETKGRFGTSTYAKWRITLRFKAHIGKKRKRTMT